MTKIELYRRIGNGRWGEDVPLGIFAEVDEEDMSRILTFHPRWRLHSEGYAYCNKRAEGKTVPIMMHRFILGTTDTNIHTDHLDHNRLNNRKSNLIACSQAENNRNLPFTGVGKFRNKWRAWTPSPTKHIGVFDTKEEAERAVESWLAKH